MVNHICCPVSMNVLFIYCVLVQRSILLAYNKSMIRNEIRSLRTSSQSPVKALGAMATTEQQH